MFSAAAPLILMALSSTGIDDDRIQLWLDERTPVVGERVRVHVRADNDGYLLVLHAEPNGRVRVLFPIEPGDDNYIRGGSRYEIRDRGDRKAFEVYDDYGYGVVYAVWSPRQYDFGPFQHAGQWDYGVPELQSVGDDPEYDLTRIATIMAAGADVTYDLMRYDVGERYAYNPPRYVYSSYYGSHYRGSGFSLTIGFGDNYYYPYYGYRRAYYYDSWRPWYYDPWGPWYYDSAWDYYWCRYGCGYSNVYVVRHPSVWVYPRRTVYGTYRPENRGGYVFRDRFSSGNRDRIDERTRYPGYSTYVGRAADDGRRRSPATAAGRTPSRGSDIGRRTISPDNRRPESPAVGTRRPSTERVTPQRRPSTERATPSRRPSTERATPERRPSSERATPERRPSSERATPERRPSNERAAPERRTSSGNRASPTADPAPKTERRPERRSSATPVRAGIVPAGIGRDPANRASPERRQPVTRSQGERSAQGNRAAPTRRPTPSVGTRNSEPSRSARPAPSRPTGRVNRTPPARRSPAASTQNRAPQNRASAPRRPSSGSSASRAPSRSSGNRAAPSRSTSRSQPRSSSSRRPSGRKP